MIQYTNGIFDCDPSIPIVRCTTIWSNWRRKRAKTASYWISCSKRRIHLSHHLFVLFIQSFQVWNSCIQWPSYYPIVRSSNDVNFQLFNWLIDFAIKLKTKNSIIYVNICIVCLCAQAVMFCWEEQSAWNCWQNKAGARHTQLKRSLCKLRLL